jgi:hypothetical protein
MVTREQLETIAKKQDISELPRLSEEAAEERYGEEPMKCVSWVEDRQKKLASAFREHMAKDQLYLTSSPNRRAFYARVIAMAKQVNFLSFPFFVRMTIFSSLWKITNQLETGKNLGMAGTFRNTKV